MKESDKNLAKSALYAMLALQIRRELDPFAYSRASDLSSLQLRHSIEKLRTEIGDQEASRYTAAFEERESVENERVRHDLLRSLSASAGERATYFAAIGYPTEGAGVPDLGQPIPNERPEQPKSAKETEDLAIATLLRYLPGYSHVYQNAQLNLQIDAIFFPSSTDDDPPLPLLLIEYKHVLTKEALTQVAAYLKSSRALFVGKDTRAILVYSAIKAMRILDEHQEDVLFVQYDARNDQLATKDLARLLKSIYPPPNTFA